jgi:hypothetical protein
MAMRKALGCALAVAAGLAAAGCSVAGAPPATTAVVTGGSATGSGISLAGAAPIQRESGPPPAAISRYRWSVLASSPLGPRSQELLVMDGGTLLELSGLSGASNTSAGKVSADAAAFDIATGRWHRIASIPGIAATSPDSWSPVSAWAGQELLVANGPLRSCAAGCWTGAALYDPAGDRWSMLTPPKQFDGLSVTAAAWTGRELIVAAADSIRERLGVGAYDPATGRWQVITPALPRHHPSRGAELVAADGRVILWSLWDRIMPVKNGGTEASGVDVLAMRQLGTWQDVTASWPQHQPPVDSPLFTGTAILLSPGQIWCGYSCIPTPTWNPGYFANPVTLARTIIPAGPLGQVNPTFTWTGDAIIAANVDGDEVDRPGHEVLPGDMALWDPATGHWTTLQSVPGRPHMSATPVWTGTGLLALTDDGSLLAFRG